MRYIVVPDPRTKLGAEAFLVGIIFNQVIKAEKAWWSMRDLCLRLDAFSLVDIARCSLNEIENSIAKSPVIHPFSRAMAANILAAAELLEERYGWDATLVWSDELNAGAIYSNLCEFRGIGVKKANTALFVLSKIRKLSEYENWNIHLNNTCEALSSAQFDFREIESFQIGKDKTI